MKILGLFDDYWPHHRSGAERMSHNILKELVRRGHSCHVITRTETTPIEVVDGVTVEPKRLMDDELKAVRECDVIMTAFNYSRRAMNLAKLMGKRLYIIIHNELNGKDLMVETFDNTRIIYNSEWVKASLKYKVPSVVFNPPVFEADWQGEGRGPFVTMLNVNEIKGGDLFVKLAAMMPKVKFLGTLGSYGANQITESRDNITILPNHDDVAKIYKQTKVLLMLSRYESYGQTQIEAGFFGIPTVYHPTAGLRESWGEAGLAIDRDNLEAWKEAITKLLKDAEYYSEWSEKARAGSRLHESKADWTGFEKFLSV